MFGFQHNYCTGLQKHGNQERNGKLHSNHRTKIQRKGHNKAYVRCLMVSKTDLRSQYITECSLDIYRL